MRGTSCEAKTGRLSCSAPATGSVSDFKKLFSNIEETKDNLADPDCCMCEGRGFYKVLCVGEYDEQEITVQCACKRKQNLSRFDV